MTLDVYADLFYADLDSVSAALDHDVLLVSVPKTLIRAKQRPLLSL